MKRILCVLVLLISYNGISQTYFYDDFNYDNFETLDSLFQNRVKTSFWRTEHAITNIDINEDGIIGKDELFKNTIITQDPFDNNNKVIRFELNKVNPKFFASYACDDSKNDNVKTDAYLEGKYNKKKKLYCSGCKDSPLKKDLYEWRTHMNRNEIAIYGKNKKLYKTKKDHWFGLRMLIDEEFELDDVKNLEIVTQFHVTGKDAKYPPIAVIIIEGRFFLAVIKNNDGKRELYDLGAVEKNKWVDWKMHLVLSNKDKKGLVEVWRDGNMIQTIIGKNISKNYKMYLKIGIYKWGWWDCGLPISNTQKKVISFDKVWASKDNLQI